MCVQEHLSTLLDQVASPLDRLVKLTDAFSCTELVHVCEHAFENRVKVVRAVGEAHTKCSRGEGFCQPFAEHHFLRALLQVRVLTARERAHTWGD